MAAIDIPGFITDLKDHAVEHGFHVHDERHFVETYSMRQNFEVDVHPESACGGPLDLHLSLDVDPKVFLAFQDHVTEIDPEAEPTNEYFIPMHFIWGLPPLSAPPDILVMTTELAGIGGTTLPLEVSSTDSLDAVSERPETKLNVVGKVEISLADIFMGRQPLCEELDRSHSVSEFLLRGVDQ